MQWIEKRPKNPDANIKKTVEGWNVRVKFLLPNRKVFDRHASASSRTEARKIRDDFYAAFNDGALEIFAEAERSFLPPDRPQLTLQQLATKCRDEWWPARGRSADIADQYYQKIATYCIPVLGADKPIDQITPDGWDSILQHLGSVTTQFSKPLSASTIRKVKACLSSALSCAVSQKYLLVNPLRGLPYNPNPLSEADRLGSSVEEIADDEAPAKRMLSDEEARELLKASKDSIIRPMIVLQLAFGLRIAEALAVQWSDFDWQKKTLKVRYQVKRRKNPKWKVGSGEPRSLLQRVKYLKSKAGNRDIYLFDDALELLKALQIGQGEALVCPSEKGGPMEPRNAQRAFSAVLEASKVKSEKPTTHSLRSWRISHWANVVALPASQLQRLAGHTRIETTLRYYVRGDTDSLRQWLDGRALPVSPLGSPALPPCVQKEKRQPVRSG